MDRPDFNQMEHIVVIKKKPIKSLFCDHSNWEVSS